jgi:hypothetical protein
MTHAETTCLQRPSGVHHIFSTLKEMPSRRLKPAATDCKQIYLFHGSRTL